ncbi:MULTISPECIES: lipopolysaccharide biosynthesis protein [unclassified Haematospirillum]|uniref:lipopolysaccharide biosynthesis protein n=1 Tax=unclassified Haematospirillum TaxID=2622088 RepID=UPI0014387179|nr:MULTISPECIES: oligosaccharide flippase family protein [unclassified Haematospirillum]NKD56033.1 oligosaccharide flippase family protein [Haematospirillum sp. H4890]NKD76036.1 oligosaccharide flippase family protein [Haematospirillum sp. H4485]
MTSRHLISRVSINLGASLLQGLLGLALMPMATFVLGPQDYGIYGMVVVVMNLVVAVCETGSAHVLYGHFHALNDSNRARLQSTLLALALMLGLLIALGVLSYWSALAGCIPLLSELIPVEVWLLCFTLPLKATWAIMSPILILTQRSEWLAASLLVQSVVNVLVILVCLYLFETGRSALFWGQWAGMLVSLVVPLILLRRSLWAPLDMRWLRKVRGVAFGAWFAGLIDNIRLILESTLTVKAVSAEALGNFNHARLYQGLMTQGTNAFANVLWPIALKEAQLANSCFPRIKPVWDFVYAGLACVGGGAVFLGDEVVSLLTHGKFVQAGAWLPWLVVHVLLQNAGKPATAVLYAAKKGNLYSSIRIFTVLVAILALLLLVPLYGVEAVLVVYIAEMIMMRVCLVLAAQRIGVVPFQDQWVVVGCLLTVICWYIERAVDLSLADRCVVVVGLSCIVLSALLMSMRIRFGQDWRRCLRGPKDHKSEETHV